MTGTPSSGASVDAGQRIENSKISALTDGKAVAAQEGELLLEPILR